MHDNSRVRASRGAESAVTASFFLFLGLLALPFAVFGGVTCALATLGPWLVGLSFAACRVAHVPGWGSKLVLHQMYLMLSAVFMLLAFAAVVGVVGGLATVATNWPIREPWNVIAGVLAGAILALPICAGMLRLVCNCADRAMSLLAALGGDEG